MSMIVETPAPLPRTEELANRLTHGLGFALSIVGTVVLLRRTALHGDTMQMVGVSVYGATLMALYAASTLSHSFERPRIRHFFRTVDQVCIFLLIAGTYTPISLTYLREGWWWALFISMWGLTLVGIFFKIFFTGLHSVTVSAYVVLGWMPAIAIKPIVAAMPAAALLWLVVGGILYTIGTLFLIRDEQVPYFHATWHVFVIAASACHYVAVMQFVVP
ncbi:MAG: hemolysin III family protein [Planctomycetia bacterium]|nr:hemolysin III family protein [Planctomycetia bacterium]